MKTKTFFKLFLDILMTAMYATLMFGYKIGSFYHEFIGVAVGIMFIIHICLNWNMLKGVIKTGKEKTKAAYSVVLDALLAIGMPIVIGTGIAMSRELFTSTPQRGMTFIHNIASWICLSIMVMHILIHAKYIAVVAKTFVKNILNRESIRAMGGFAILLLCLAVVQMSAFYSVNGTANAINKQEITQGAEQKRSKKDKKEDQEIKQSTTSSSSDTAEIPTLEDFLSKMFCNGCHRHCPLISPSCGKGEAYLEQAKASYQEQYKS